MASTRLRAWLAIGTTIGALAASCTPGARNSDPVAATVGGVLGDQQKQPCNAQRVAAELIVLKVEGMESESASRIGDALAEQYRFGFVSVSTDPQNDLVTILAKVDSDANAAKAIEIVKGLGFDAREASDDDYQTAQAALSAGEISIPISAVTEETDSATADQTPDAPLQSLATSLVPLRDRFNRDKGRLRFVAILSPT